MVRTVEEIPGKCFPEDPFGIAVEDDGIRRLPGLTAREVSFLIRRILSGLFQDVMQAPYSTTTQSLLLRPNTSGEYISSALAGGTTNVPGVVARVMYVYS